MSEPQARLRADAQRNRERILTAAGELFADRGVDVSMDEIALAAGVGVGTVYRRFPDREALIEALFEEKREAIAGIARRAQEIDDPWEALIAFMRAMARLQAQDRGLREVLLSDRGRERVAAIRGTIRPVAAELIRRAKDAGALREDVEDFDLPMMQLAISTIADLTRDVQPDYYERLLTLFLDGLARRRDGTTPLPSAPLGTEEFTTVMSRRRRV
jgi:AcrR family transcriptional regulator